jgi:putative serine protease PepD
MSEHDQNRQHDDAQPIGSSGDAPQPPGGQTPHSHRYGDAGYTQQDPYSGQRYDEHGYAPGYSPTASYDTRGWNDQAGHYGPYSGAGQQQPKRSRPSGGFTAALLVAALVVGGLAGVGGAAGFAAISSLADGGGSSGNGSITSSVIERDDAPASEGSVQAVADSVLPSVVKINVRGSQGQGSGSGVVISDDGEILTNYHVVEVAEQGGNISVAFNDGSSSPAEIIGTDPLTDLAVIEAQDASSLTPAALGKSGNLDVGEEVVAIGSPFGLDATVTSGIVSALHRPVSVSGQGSSIDTAYPAIQTDAAINPGNSGGPLVNMDSSIRTSSSSAGQGGSIGLGFAIPLDEVLPIVDQLRAGETATHAQLGVSVLDATSDDGAMTGAGIAEVEAGSAADEAGLQRGDVVLKVDDHTITDASSLVATVRGHRPGDQVTLTVQRGDEQVELEATLDSDEGQPAS